MDPRAAPGFYISIVLLLSACGGEEATPTPTLPPAVTPEATPPEDTTPFPGGVISPGGDVTPTEEVVVTESGRWIMSPPGGPYDAMSGELRVIEAPPGFVEEEDEPLCLRVYALSGSLLAGDGASGCSGCGITLEVEHVQVEAQGLCAHPDSPAAGEIRSMGYASGEGAIFLDYRGSGQWVPWYDAERQSDIITYDWSESFGYLNPAEEED